MKFYEKLNLILEDDDKEIPPKDAEDAEAAMTEKINKKIAVLGDEAGKKLENIVKTKADILISKIQKSSIDEVLENFITQNFVPSLKDPNDKLFVTVNLDDFLEYVTTKFGEILSNGVEIEKPKKIENKENKEEK